MTCRVGVFALVGYPRSLGVNGEGRRRENKGQGFKTWLVKILNHGLKYRDQLTNDL